MIPEEKESRISSVGTKKVTNNFGKKLRVNPNLIMNAMEVGSPITGGELSRMKSSFGKKERTIRIQEDLSGEFVSIQLFASHLLNIYLMPVLELSEEEIEYVDFDKSDEYF